MVRKQSPRWVHQENATINLQKEIVAKYFQGSPIKTLILDSKRDCYFSTQSRPYGLPTEEEVRQAILLNNFNSDADIISWFVKNRDNKYGVRQEVQEILKKEHKFKNDEEVIVEEYRQHAAL